MQLPHTEVARSGRHAPYGTSPYGRSMDLVDIAAHYMEGGRRPVHSLPYYGPCVCWPGRSLAPPLAVTVVAALLARLTSGSLCQALKWRGVAAVALSRPTAMS